MSFDHIFVNDCNKLPLTHWGRVTHICVSKLTIIGSDNGLSPERRQAIIWTNAGILIIGPLGTNFSRNSNIFIEENVIENVVCEMAAILSRPQCIKMKYSKIFRQNVYIYCGMCMWSTLSAHHRHYHVVHTSSSVTRWQTRQLITAGFEGSVLV